MAQALTPTSSECEVKVEELSVALTPKMKVIQAHLVALVESCLVELRKCSRLDTTELSVEKALFKSFDMYLQRQVREILTVYIYFNVEYTGSLT